MDIYALGNILHGLTLEPKYQGLNMSEEQQMVREGILPKPPPSNDPIDKVLYDAAKMCWALNAAERPSAREVERFLKDELEKFDPGRLASWKSNADAATATAAVHK